MWLEHVGVFVGPTGFLPSTQCLEYSAKIGMGLNIAGGNGDTAAMKFGGANCFALFKVKASKLLVDFNVFNTGGKGPIECFYGLWFFQDTG